jgi:hypothetical protein
MKTTKGITCLHRRGGTDGRCDSASARQVAQWRKHTTRAGEPAPDHSEEHPGFQLESEDTNRTRYHATLTEAGAAFAVSPAVSRVPKTTRRLDFKALLH